jgi:hypothetical protein
MAFPHRTASYPNLSTVVALPERPATGEGASATRGERRRRRVLAVGGTEEA